MWDHRCSTEPLGQPATELGPDPRLLTPRTHLPVSAAGRAVQPTRGPGQRCLSGALPSPRREEAQGRGDRRGPTRRAEPGGDSRQNKKAAEFSRQVKAPWERSGSELSRAVNPYLLPKSPERPVRQREPVSTLQDRAFYHLHSPHPQRKLPRKPRTCWFCQASGSRGKPNPGSQPVPTLPPHPQVSAPAAERAQILSRLRPAAPASLLETPGRAKARSLCTWVQPTAGSR